MGNISSGLGFWTTRVRTRTGSISSDYDNWFFVALRAQGGTGGNPNRVVNGFLNNSSTYTTLYNGALRPANTIRRINTGSFPTTVGIFIPETDDQLSCSVIGVGNLIDLYVNGDHYARYDLTGVTSLTYGPRYGWLGDSGGYNGNKALLRNAFVGIPDPLNVIP